MFSLDDLTKSEIDGIVTGLSLIASIVFFWVANNRLNRIEAALRIQNTNPKEDAETKRMKGLGLFSLVLAYILQVTYFLRNYDLPFI